MNRPSPPLLCLLLLLWGSPLQALAQDQETCDQGVASTLYKRGASLYAENDFGPALSSFTSAYNACPYPVFLQAMSVCQAKLGQLDEAILTAERALLLHGQRGNVIGGLAQNEILGTHASVLAWQTVQRTNRLAKRLASTPPDAPLPPPQGAILDTAPPTSTSPLPRALGWSLVGLGAASLLTSGISAIVLDERLDQARAATTADSPEALDQAKAKAATLQTLGKITLFGGAGALAGGLATLLLFPSTPTVQVHLHPGGVGAGWAVQF